MWNGAWDGEPKEVVLREFCAFCFAALLAHLRGLPQPALPPCIDPELEAPIFVTWTKHRGTDGRPELRGCIGCLDSVKLRRGLGDYALRSSQQDRRFPPIGLEELPGLSCRVSVLHGFEPCSHAYDWALGVHGIVVKFMVAENGGAARAYSSTYLPEVPVEHHMSHEVAISQLVRKAGYEGDFGEQLMRSLCVTRYRSSGAQLDYNEFRALQETNGVDLDRHGSSGHDRRLWSCPCW